MQIKTIRKNIEHKLNEWLETISDKDLREAVKNNLLVSGGSITSMLLNEDVNDYDVYLKDRSVLLSLVKYYTKTVSGISILDGHQKEQMVADIENNYKSYLTQFEEGDISDINNQFAVSLRNLQPDQIKLFMGGAGKRMEYSAEQESTYRVLFFSPNAISLSDNVQIVIRFHGNAEQIHKTFDFIHATNYFTFEDGVVTNKEALESIITKQLRYQGSQYPVTTIIRVRKFLKRNWNIGAGELLKVMFQISELSLKDPDVLEEQLIGVDVAYFDKLIEILRGVDSEKINSHYINTLIDKIFDNE